MNGWVGRSVLKECVLGFWARVCHSNIVEMVSKGWICIENDILSRYKMLEQNTLSSMVFII